MTKQFIQILSFSVVLISCREIDDVNTVDPRNNEIKTELKGENFSTPVSKSSAEDSVKTDVMSHQDPPIKHQGHWRTK